MELSKMKESLKALQLERQTYNHISSIMSTDGETAAPPSSARARGDVMAFLSQKSYQLLVNDETRALLDGLWEKKDELDEITVRQVELLRKELKDLTCIPMDEYAAYSRLTNDATSAWLSAKANNDYASFEPWLKDVIDFNRRFAAYREPGMPAYEAMLDSYEQGMRTAMLDPFFAMLRKELVPLMEEASKLPPKPAFVSAACDVNRQRELSSYLMDAIGIDRDRCTLTETEHPFTNSANRYDVRITTHYYPNAFLSSVYSVIHEGGHALYELGVADEYQNTALSATPSLGMHESQSRFYENLVGHSMGFLSHIAPKLRELFPDVMNGVTDRELFKAVNHVQPSLIRTEADQVTYPLHIMVRYELEKQLVAGTLSTKDLPEAWNALYKEYLGVDVPNDSLGVLQDTHWACGLLGYFPTYALGSAYASQLFHAMEKDLDMQKLLSTGEIKPITAWLGDRIHRWGNRYAPVELLKRATGEDFNPAYYVAHLKQVIADLKD